MELYWFPGTCSRVPLIALEEIGEPFDLRLVVRVDPDEMAGYELEVNPKGKVPALAVDGRVLTENPAIQTYLNRRFPAAGLLPSEPERQLDALMLMSWFAAGIHPVISRTRFPRFVCDSPESFDRIREMGLSTLAGIFALLESRLEGGPWLFGGDWTIVDGYLLWLWFRAVGSGLDPGPFPRLAEHARRSEQRPSIQRALDREERTWAELTGAGRIPPDTPPHAVGRIAA